MSQFDKKEIVLLLLPIILASIIWFAGKAFVKFHPKIPQTTQELTAINLAVPALKQKNKNPLQIDEVPMRFQVTKAYPSTALQTVAPPHAENTANSSLDIVPSFILTSADKKYVVINDGIYKEGDNVSNIGMIDTIKQDAVKINLKGQSKWIQLK